MGTCACRFLAGTAPRLELVPTVSRGSQDIHPRVDVDVHGFGCPLQEAEWQPGIPYHAVGAHRPQEGQQPFVHGRRGAEEIPARRNRGTRQHGLAEQSPAKPHPHPRGVQSRWRPPLVQGDISQQESQESDPSPTGPSKVGQAGESGLRAQGDEHAVSRRRPQCVVQVSDQGRRRMNGEASQSGHGVRQRREVHRGFCVGVHGRSSATIVIGVPEARETITIARRQPRVRRGPRDRAVRRVVGGIVRRRITRPLEMHQLLTRLAVPNGHRSIDKRGGEPQVVGRPAGLRLEIDVHRDLRLARPCSQVPDVDLVRGTDGQQSPVW